MLKKCSTKCKVAVFATIVLLLIIVIVCFCMHTKKDTSAGKLPKAASVDLSSWNADTDVSTKLAIHHDGTFKGYSYKVDAATGSDKGGSYSCYFHGRFSKIKKINEYKYSMVLSELKYDKAPKKAEKTANMEAYGLEKDVKYIMYISGAPMDGMNNTFLKYSAKRVIRSKQNLLMGNALWNTKDGYGFFSGITLE